MIRSPLFAVDVKNGCNGIEAALLLLAAMLAFPAPPKARAIGIAAGLAAIQGVNLFRIVSLFWLGAHRRDVFELFHAAIWQTTLILLAVGIFLRGAAPGAEAPLKPALRALAGFAVGLALWRAATPAYDRVLAGFAEG